MVTGYVPFGAAKELIGTLQIAGCQKIVVEQKEGDIRALSAVVSALQKDDVLVFVSVEHVKDFIGVLAQAGRKRAHVKALVENIDTFRDTTQFSSDAQQQHADASLSTVA